MQHQDAFSRRGGFGFRARRGNLTPTILHLLLEKSMHGYEIISILEKKTHGLWRPSAGAIYPSLQMLEEQGLVVSKEQSGKRVYSLTRSGRKQANEQTDEPAWNDERIAKLRSATKRRVVLETINLMRRITLSGTDEDITAAEQILGSANEKLKGLTNKKEQ